MQYDLRCRSALIIASLVETLDGEGYWRTDFEGTLLSHPVWPREAAFTTLASSLWAGPAIPCLSHITSDFHISDYFIHSSTALQCADALRHGCLLMMKPRGPPSFVTSGQHAETSA